MTDNRRPGEIEVAQRVQHLVPDELVDVAEPLAIQHLVAADDHRIVERAAPRQSRSAELVYFVKEAEAARAADIRFEALGVNRDRELLPADRIGREVDGEVDGKSIIGGERRRLAAVADSHRLQHANGAPRCTLFDNPRAFHEEDKGRGASIHGRHFRAVDVDDRIVDLKAGKCGHEMLHRRDRVTAAIVKARAERLLDRIMPTRRQLDAIAIGAPEHDAGIGGGWA